MIEFEPGDAIRYLPCMHTYHMECIDDWLMRSFTCPSCMEPVDAALLGNNNIEIVRDLQCTAVPVCSNSAMQYCQPLIVKPTFRV